MTEAAVTAAAGPRTRRESSAPLPSPVLHSISRTEGSEKERATEFGGLDDVLFILSFVQG